MPNHRAHDIIGFITSIPMTSGVYTLIDISTDDINTTVYGTSLFLASHIFSTIFLSPDLDINSRIYNRWGMFKFLWYPYRELVEHRSFFSHSVIGGIARMVYILILCGAVAAIAANDALQTVVELTLANPTYMIVLLLGAASASGWHVLADRCWRSK